MEQVFLFDTTPSVPQCRLCKLNEKCNSPNMDVYGKGTNSILIVGEAPGKTEDEKGIPFIGESGQVLRKELKMAGIKFKECRVMNAINCRPPGNRTPTAREIRYCRPKVLSEIKRYSPKIIFLFGGSAVESVIGYRWKKDLSPLEKWIGRAIPDQYYKSWVIPNYHPSFLIRSGMQGDYLLKFRDGIALWRDLSDPPDYSYVYDRVRLLVKEDEIVYVISKMIKENKPVAFDYETNSLKPYLPGSRVYTVSMCNGDYSYAFPVISKKVREAFKKFLKSKVRKIAHNMKYEAVWSKMYFGVYPRNLYWDTMLYSHYLDNRSKVSGLKFQVYVNYGIPDYSDEIDKYLQSTTTGYNKVEDADLSMVLKYNALDSLFTYMLYKDQKGGV